MSVTHLTADKAIKRLQDENDKLKSTNSEMLEALKRSLRELEMFSDNAPPFTKELKKLIKKATEL